MEADLISAPFETLHYYGSGGQCSMTEEGDFDGSGDEEGGFGEIVLGSNGLQDLVGGEGLHGHDGSGIAGEQAGGKRVEFEDGQTDALLFTGGLGSRPWFLRQCSTRERTSV